jgi:hypothetical protein
MGPRQFTVAVMRIQTGRHGDANAITTEWENRGHPRPYMVAMVHGRHADAQARYVSDGVRRSRYPVKGQPQVTGVRGCAHAFTTLVRHFSPIGQTNVMHCLLATSNVQ